MYEQQTLIGKAQRQRSDTLFHLGAASATAAVLIILMAMVHGMHTVVDTQYSVRENAAKLVAAAQAKPLPPARALSATVRIAQTKPLEGA